MSPSIEPTLGLTLRPTIINKEIRYKILGFYIDIELINFGKSELSDNDKDILLYSFEKITEIYRGYLSIKDKNLILKRLLFTTFDIQFYTLKETIIISIPLIDDYTIYDKNPIELYNSLLILITSSLNSTMFLDIIKEYNSSSFNNMHINLVKISEPEITTIINKNINTNNSNNTNHISYKDLAYILVFGILGIIIITWCFYYKVYKKKYNYRASLIHNKHKNKIYFMGENDIENSSENLKDLSEESRIVETTNTEL